MNVEGRPSIGTDAETMNVCMDKVKRLIGAARQSALMKKCDGAP